jgi:hypothetical protein
MKKLLLLLLLSTAAQLAIACDVCKKQQPKVLQGITHGAGPQSNWDYVIVVLTCVLVITCLYSSVRHLIHPKEQTANHIKYSILNADDHGRQ